MLLPGSILSYLSLRCFAIGYILHRTNCIAFETCEIFSLQNPGTQTNRGHQFYFPNKCFGVNFMHLMLLPVFCSVNNLCPSLKKRVTTVSWQLEIMHIVFHPSCLINDLVPRFPWHLWVL